MRNPFKRKPKVEPVRYFKLEGNEKPRLRFLGEDFNWSEYNGQHLTHRCTAFLSPSADSGDMTVPKDRCVLAEDHDGNHLSERGFAFVRLWGPGDREAFMAESRRVRAERSE